MYKYLHACGEESRITALATEAINTAYLLTRDLYCVRGEFIHSGLRCLGPMKNNRIRIHGTSHSKPVVSTHSPFTHEPKVFHVNLNFSLPSPTILNGPPPRSFLLLLLLLLLSIITLSLVSFLFIYISKSSSIVLLYSEPSLSWSIFYLTKSLTSSLMLIAHLIAM